jgi:hypothetical protein
MKLNYYRRRRYYEIPLGFLKQLELYFVVLQKKIAA